MAQFEVYPNPQPASRDSVPFVVDVQSAILSHLPSRLVMPLSRVGVTSPQLPRNLCPILDVEGEPLSLMPHQAAPVSARLLRRPVASLAHRAGDIRSALDAVLSGV